MDDAFQLAAKIGLHRQHIAVAAHRDDRLLQRVAAGIEQALQAAHQPVVSHAHLGADTAQRRAGRVGDIAVAVEGAANVGFQARQRLDAGDQGGQAGQATALLLAPQDLGAHFAARFQRAEDRQELGRVKRRAQVGPFDGHANVVDPAQAQVGPQFEQAHSLAGAALAAAHFVQVAHRGEGFDSAASGAKRGIAGQPGQDFGEFERGESFSVHPLQPPPSGQSFIDEGQQRTGP